MEEALPAGRRGEEAHVVWLMYSHGGGQKVHEMGLERLVSLARYL